MIHTGKVEIKFETYFSMDTYDRLSGLGAKPILYRTINISVIVFTA